MNDKKLIKLYLEGRTSRYIGGKLGVTPATINSRLTRLRKLGLNLPRVAKKNVLDIDKLNKYVEKLRRHNVSQQ